jgi:hypothetical protein
LDSEMWTSLGLHMVFSRFTMFYKFHLGCTCSRCFTCFDFKVM